MTQEIVTSRKNSGNSTLCNWGLCALMCLIMSSAVWAQERQVATEKIDPRVGLSAGFRDAGEAIHNLELVESLPKPAGFFDPESPSGYPTPPEKEEKEEPDAAAEDKTNQSTDTSAHPSGENESPEGESEVPDESLSPSRRSFSNTDLAFSGDHLFIGSYHGFNTYNVEDPRRLRLLTSVVCPGGQGDVSVYGNLLFMSVQETRSRLDCGTGGIEETVSAERFRGVRIFDISDVRAPKQVAAVQTCRGSHTHSLVIDPNDQTNLYVYNSGTNDPRPAEELGGCSDAEPEEDENTALFSIDVIQVPLDTPEKARIVNRPHIFADPKTGVISGLWQGGDHGPGTQTTKRTTQCHDLTVFPELGLAAGACAGNGILLDISDPINPVRLDQVVDKNFAYWHSATFNNDGSKIVFTDEWGGGSRPRCRETDLPIWGANAIFDIVDGKLQFRSYYKMPAAQTEEENCVAHNGSLIPVPGRDIMAQAWYQGGLSIFDFTDSTNPQEIAFFDRGPLDATTLMSGGYWSTYWYNGHIYGAEIARGIDVFKLLPSEYLSENEITAATEVRFEEFNAQRQPQVSWRASSAVARAYVDQLVRSESIPPSRVSAVDSILSRVDALRRNDDSAVVSVVDELKELVNAIEVDAGLAEGRNADRLQALAETLGARAASLR